MGHHRYVRSRDFGDRRARPLRHAALCGRGYDELGVTPMSLYRYVDSKEALLEAIADRVFEELELPAGDSADWREQLRLACPANR